MPKIAQHIGVIKVERVLFLTLFFREFLMKNEIILPHRGLEQDFLTFLVS